ncbi:MAG: hypothetical protein WBY94_09590 [Polyangiaceae bacterium]
MAAARSRVVRSPGDRKTGSAFATIALCTFGCSSSARAPTPKSAAPDSAAPDSAAPDSSSPEDGGQDSPADEGFAIAPHTPYPQISTQGGGTLASVRVVSVSFQGDSNTPDLVAFLDWMAQSTWLSEVAGEYGVLGITQHLHVDLPGPAPAALTDGDIRTLLAAKIADGTVPGAQAQATPLLYVMIFPNGSSVQAPTGGDACTDIPGNGYHESTGSAATGDPYIVMPACDPRFSAVLSQLQGMELETARLVVDSLTDPNPTGNPGYVLTDPSNPWTAIGPELGDFCWGRLTQDGAYTLQRVFSNRAAASGADPCVPAPVGSVPFGMTTSPVGLQTLQVAVPFAFTVTGWSAQAVPDWSFQATPWVGDYAVEATVDKSTLNNGQTATLQVTVPYAVPPGTYGTVRLEALTGSDSPSWPVAFVVR